MVLQEGESCPVCQKEEETCGHLFFLCDNSQKLWASIFAWWHLGLISHNSITLAHCWEKAKQMSQKKTKAIWKVVVSAAL